LSAKYAQTRPRFAASLPALSVGSYLGHGSTVLAPLLGFIEQTYCWITSADKLLLLTFLEQAKPIIQAWYPPGDVRLSTIQRAGISHLLTTGEQEGITGLIELRSTLTQVSLWKPADREVCAIPIQVNTPDGTPIEQRFWARAQQSPILTDAGMVPQYPVLSYFLDVAFPDLKIGVELDGWFWHNVTPAQRQKDYQRERQLLGAGWRLMRFMGSEITQDVDRCVREVECLIQGSSLLASSNKTST
jgi:very-short-patch-repair endonuclease